MPLIAKLVAMLHLVDTTEVYTEVIVTRGKRNEPSMFAPYLLSVGNSWPLRKAACLPCSHTTATSSFRETAEEAACNSTSNRRWKGKGKRGPCQSFCNADAKLDTWLHRKKGRP